MYSTLAKPLSRMNIRDMAHFIRKIEESENDLFFDIIHFVEITLPKLDSSFAFNIKSKSEMGECHGLTYPDRNEINIREDVYEGACNGNGRDRLTISHELFHLIQHTADNICFARTNSEIKPYRSPEWQATAFGGELLIPHHLIKGMEILEIMEACKVSEDAAVYQKKFT